jgi:DNA-binding CsgD family transcriptional regulator
MTTRVNDGLGALTEKEKQTLRLMVRGHDAKSIARSLDLSVHTINERLREARRKLTVSSSREAARLLLDAEGGDLPAAPTPEMLGDMPIGEDPSTCQDDQEATPSNGAWRIHRHSSIILGVCSMTLVLGLLALTAVPQVAPTPALSTTTGQAAQDTQVVQAARRWLALLDQSRWNESYQATGTAFRKLNTAEVWTAASLQARVPLGAVVSRTLAGQESLPAPPSGYEVVKFRTRFANKPDAVETVSLEHEDGDWRVVGVTIG